MNVIDFNNKRNILTIMDSVRIHALMFFPQDEKTRLIYTSHITLHIHLQLKERAYQKKQNNDVSGIDEINNIADSLLEGFFKYYGYKAFKYSFSKEDKSLKRRLDNSWIRGIMAGDILRNIIRIDRYFKAKNLSETASIGKAMHLQEIGLKDLQTLDDRKIPASHSNLESIWSEYKQVAHFWASYDDMHILYKQKKLDEGWIDSDLYFVNPTYLPTWFSFANFYRDFAINHISEKIKKPLIDDDLIWALPDHLNISIDEPACIELLTLDEIKEVTHGYQAKN